MCSHREIESRNRSLWTSPSTGVRRPAYGPPSLVPTLTLGALLLTVGGVGTARAEEFTESLRLESEVLVLRNLVGKVEVRPSAGSAFEVEVQVRGRDASRERIRIESDGNRRATVDVVFPLEEERDYVYPEIDGETSFSVQDAPGEHEGGWVRRLLGAVGSNQVRVRGSGSGLEVWADVHVLVPEGGILEIRHGAGDIAANGVHGELDLDSQSGRIIGEQVVGALTADTGSGDIFLQGVDGEVRCDTGSGNVEVADIRGPLLLADTGSGDVHLDGVICKSLRVDTGSGSVRGRGLSAEGADVDTGSGDVRLEFTAMGPGSFVVDTGSGGIDLLLPADASAEVVASTGSGGIDVDVAGAEVRSRGDDDVAFRVGSGDAHVELDAGSGRITVAN